MKYNQAQTLSEYALLIAIISAAIFGMQVYVKRGLQARYKTVVDVTGESVGIKQYEPYYVQSDQTIERELNTAYTYRQKGKLERGVESTMTGNATIITGLDISADDDWF
jgi:Flp pilus assembly pilin Flp